MLNFNFSKKSLGLASPPHFVYDLSRKTFVMLYSINRPNFIVRLHFISRYWALCVLQLFVNQAVVLSLWCLPFFSYQIVLLHNKKSRQKPKYLENEKCILSK